MSEHPALLLTTHGKKWHFQVWDDGEAFWCYESNASINRYGIARFAFVPGYFVVEFINTEEKINTAGESHVINGPFKTFKAAELMYQLLL